MRFIYLILITFMFSLLNSPKAQAELPYAQKILLVAEYERTGKNLKLQVDEIKRMRENIKKGKTVYEEVRNIMESLYVYALENLHKQNKQAQFRRLAQLLNNNSTRNKFYYPVSVDGGFSGTRQSYVSWKDTKCVNPVNQKDIQTGVFVNVDSGAFKRMNFPGTNLVFTEKFFLEKKEVTSLKSYPLAHFKLSDESHIYPLLEDLGNLSTDLTKYYSCEYISQFNKLESDNKKLNARYLQLAMVLNKDKVNP